MAREFTHHVTFRTRPAEQRELLRLKNTFGEEGGWGATFRWLLEQPGVKQVVQERLNEMSPAGADGMWGIERSVPVGDR